MKTKRVWLIFVVVLVIIGAIACAPAKNTEEERIQPAPTSSEALSFPAPTETPMPAPTLQQTGRVTFYYKLADNIREEMFGGTYVDHETLTFTRNPDGKWSIEQPTPILLNYGPLYKLLTYNFPSAVIGNCPIDTYPNSDNGVIGSYNPLCPKISSEEAVSLTLSLANCNIDVQESIICFKETLNGKLYYKLYKNLDVFEFYYTGFWSEDEYPDWINQATQTLGFPSVDKNFYKDIKAWEVKTIKKNH